MVALPEVIYMNNLLSFKNINIFIAVAIVVVIVITIIVSDTYMTPSDSQIDLSLRPCKIVDGIQIEVLYFEFGGTPHICGEVLSEFVPLELDYYLVNSTNNELVLSAEYIKVTTHEFIVDLPSNLDVGEYEFEIKAGRRKHLASTKFEISR